MDSLQGHLLIAGGGLLDLNFRHTVVLVAEHSPLGAFGLVLNHPASIKAAEAAPSLAQLVPPDDPVYLGGPVQPDSAMILADFEHPDFAAKTVVGSIGLLGDQDQSDRPAGIRRARVFAGHAGWGPGQLESELTQQSWITEPALPEDVFSSSSAELWSRVLRRKGGEFAVLALMPFDPSTN
jgi:putative transcriptional regulator